MDNNIDVDDEKSSHLRQFQSNYQLDVSFALLNNIVLTNQNIVWMWWNDGDIWLVQAMEILMSKSSNLNILISEWVYCYINMTDQMVTANDLCSIKGYLTN